MFNYEWEEINVSAADANVAELVEFYKNSDWIKRV
jgi:hypothetical protein